LLLYIVLHTTPKLTSCIVTAYSTTYNTQANIMQYMMLAWVLYAVLYTVTIHVSMKSLVCNIRNNKMLNDVITPYIDTYIRAWFEHPGSNHLNPRPISMSQTSVPQIYVLFSNSQIGIHFSNLWPVLTFSNRRLDLRIHIRCLWHRNRTWI
jgi:hypothetical protein